jgi:drug/metabolite transporter (DMT)-like permease
MTVGVTIGLGLGWVAAAATSLGWLMKSRGARATVRMRHRRPWRSLRALFASRWFAAGVLIASAGGLLHIAALALAPISTVQAVMATGIVVLGVMAERLFGWPVPPRQWAGVALTALGLVLLAVSLPDLRGAHSSFSTPTMIGFDVALLIASLLLLLAPRAARLRAHDGALIGASAGALFGLSDVAIKALFGVAGHGLASVLLSPWLALAVLTGLVAQYVSARSLQTGDAISVTALTGVAVNAANIVGGILVFGDPLARGLTGSVVEGTAFVLICGGAFLTPVRAELAERGRHATQPVRTPPHAKTGASEAEPAPAVGHGDERGSVRSSRAGATQPRPQPLRRSAVRPRSSSHPRAATAARWSMHRVESQRMPLPGALATTAVTLLIASKISDWLEPYVGFDAFNLALALTVGFGAARLIAALTYDLLDSRPAQRRSTTSQIPATSILVTLGTAALGLIGVEHLHHLPAVDGWLGVAGGLLMLTAALANHQGPGRRPPLPRP